MKILPDRTILLSPGEALPAPFVGKYVQVPGEPNRYQIGFLPCVHHGHALQVLPCGRKFMNDHCKLKDIYLSPTICSLCKERPE